MPTTVTSEFAAFTTYRPLEARPGEEQFDPIHAQLGRLASLPVVILGIPGAGKTTLANELKQLDQDINYISLGAISRDLDPESPERKELDRLFAIGKPVGNPQLFLDILEPHVDKALERSGGFILDGMPKKVEEIDPLLSFLSSKNALPKLVISCEVPPLVALERTEQRAERPGDQDTTEIFLNRTKTYLRELDQFKSALTADHQPLIIADTHKHLASSAAKATVLLVNPRMRTTESAEDDSKSKRELLYEYMRAGNRADALRIIGPDFDGTLGNIDYGAVCDASMEHAEKRAYIEAAFLLREPNLQETPYFLQRLAENYIANTLGSVEHVYESCIEEVTLRYGEDFEQKHVDEVYDQQTELRRCIQELQAKLTDGESLFSLTNAEIVYNFDELRHIQQVLRDRAEAIGTPAADIVELMQLQPKIWNQLTSNQVLFAPDYNYRRIANSVPNSHHSLIPYTDNPRALSANSMGQYVPFIEAVSATENHYHSTFGFIHFVGIDKNGEAYGVEYPIMMHDQRLLDLNSTTVNTVLENIDKFYGNHDLWHNLLPVYAQHFILHHPDAPLSYGGRLPAYQAFGTDLRAEKEEYEIGMAMMHARSQQERFLKQPELRAEQERLILDSLDMLHQLPTELALKVSPEEITTIIDYLACRAATKAYNVFPDKDPIYDTIRQKLDELNVAPLTLTSSTVADLLLMQRLLDPEVVTATLGTSHLDEQRQAILEDDQLASAIIREALAPYAEDRESGAEHIALTLQAWGVIDTLSAQSQATINPLQKSRWLAMTGPQRQQLRGHMEKVHGKAGYVFGDRHLDEPRDLVVLQKQAIDSDKATYDYRVAARITNQRLSYGLYSLLFDDQQDLNKQARDELTRLRTSEDTGQRLFAREIVGVIDSLMHELVANTFAPAEKELAYIKAYAESVENQSGNIPTHLSNALRDIAERYESLARDEQAQQTKQGRSYQEAARMLVDEQMTIA